MPSNKIIYLLIFLAVLTVVVVSVDTKTTARVRISNQAFEINNSQSEYLNVKSLDLQSKEANFKNNSDANPAQNKSAVSFQNTDIKNNSKSVNNSGVVNNSEIGTNIQEINLQNKNIKTDPAYYAEYLKIEKNRINRRYNHIAVNWSDWHENLQNAILDKSYELPELDAYPLNTMLYFSFYVRYDGTIYDIHVSSPTISQEDKDKMAKLIKTFEHTTPLVFPPKTKRKRCKVSGIILLTDNNNSKFYYKNKFNSFEHRVEQAQ